MCNRTLDFTPDHEREEIRDKVFVWAVGVLGWGPNLVGAMQAEETLRPLLGADVVARLVAVRERITGEPKPGADEGGGGA